MKITRTTPYKPTFRAQKVVGMFDVPVEERLTRTWDLDLSGIPEEWGIGCIVGPSGAGKTTLAQELYGAENVLMEHEWPDDVSFLEGFPEDCDVQDIVNTLSHVGFASPPSWLQPYGTLSNGQKFRADMARAMLSKADPIVIDEYTSVVDRNVAKIASAAVSKTIRRAGKRFVAVTCHYDVIEWLEPDWVLDMATGKVIRGTDIPKGPLSNSLSARSLEVLGDFSATITI